MNLCRSCDQDFSSVRLFDAHRVGAYAPGDYSGDLEDWTPELGRRCLSIEEMQERGWEPNDCGAWQDPIRVEQARRAFRDTSETPSEVLA